MKSRMKAWLNPSPPTYKNRHTVLSMQLGLAVKPKLSQSSCPSLTLVRQQLCFFAS